MFFTTLGQAINAGIDKAINDLLVIVHEDVVLLPGWQEQLELSLENLETFDPQWLVAGSVGWDVNGKMEGHLSDPHLYRNTLIDKSFSEVIRIDEQIIILRKSEGLIMDPAIPSIHHIGRDLPLEAIRQGRHAYVIDAPTIHKYADSEGKIIHGATDSPKIQLRSRLTYLADRACSNEYIANKWKQLDISSLNVAQAGHWSKDSPPLPINLSQLSQFNQRCLASPIILLAKGGSGSRLLSLMAQDIGLFTGNQQNIMGDSREMARTVYRGFFRKHQCPGKWQQSRIIPDLQATAAGMLEQAGWPQAWGFKLPESLFLLHELKQAFPNAKYVFLRRDPVATSLKRSHMTARTDNQVGQVTLRLAYDYFKLQQEQILLDHEVVRMARTTAHQLDITIKFKEEVSPGNWLDLAFEDLFRDPQSVLMSFADFCDQEIHSSNLIHEFDPQRACAKHEDFSKETALLVESILEPICNVMGYT